MFDRLRDLRNQVVHGGVTLSALELEEYRQVANQIAAAIEQDGDSSASSESL